MQTNSHRHRSGFTTHALPCDDAFSQSPPAGVLASSCSLRSARSFILPSASPSSRPAHPVEESPEHHHRAGGLPRCLNADLVFFSIGPNADTSRRLPLFPSLSLSPFSSRPFFVAARHAISRFSSTPSLPQASTRAPHARGWQHQPPSVTRALSRRVGGASPESPSRGGSARSASLCS